MNRPAAIFVAALVVLTTVNFLWPAPPSPLSSSSFGRAGSGHGALYDLLAETGLGRGRSFESARRLADAGTLWWIDPIGVCDGRIARSGEVDVLDAEDVAWPVGEWLRSGGVGIVFLQSGDGGPVLEAQQELVACDAIAGMLLPDRERLAGEGPEVEAGAVVEQARRLPLAEPYAFVEALDWNVAARIRSATSEPRPFVLERSVGKGRLVVVADSGFTHNLWLDQADSAPLAIDLVAAFGAPRFDEREHGFLPETNALRYIAGSAALPVYVGLLVLALLHAWRGSALPARRVQEFDPAAPTLETYTASMAALYAGTRDHARVLDRYRELTASRLRRHFGLSQEVSRRALAERIERDPRTRCDPAREPEGAARLRERLLALVEPGPVATTAALEAAVRELDALVLEVTR